MIELNRDFSEQWPVITLVEPLADADDFKGISGKLKVLFPHARQG